MVEMSKTPLAVGAKGELIERDLRYLETVWLYKAMDWIEYLFAAAFKDER